MDSEIFKLPATVIQGRPLSELSTHPLLSLAPIKECAGRGQLIGVVLLEDCIAINLAESTHTLLNELTEFLPRESLEVKSQEPTILYIYPKAEVKPDAP